MLDTYAYLLVLKDYNGIDYTWFTYQEFFASPDSGVAFTLKSTHQTIASIYNEIYLSEEKTVEIDKLYKPLLDRELIMKDGQLELSLIGFMGGVDSQFLEKGCEELYGSESFKDFGNKVYIVTFSIANLSGALERRDERRSRPIRAIDDGYLPTQKEIADHIQPAESKDLISVHNPSLFGVEEEEGEARLDIRALAFLSDGSFVIRVNRPGEPIPVIGVDENGASGSSIRLDEPMVKVRVVFGPPRVGA